MFTRSVLRKCSINALLLGLAAMTASPTPRAQDAPLTLGLTGEALRIYSIPREDMHGGQRLGDGPGPSHVFVVDRNLVVIDPWSALITVFDLNLNDDPGRSCSFPRDFEPWRLIRRAHETVVVSEPQVGRNGLHAVGSARIRSERSHLIIAHEQLERLGASGGPCPFQRQPFGGESGAPFVAPIGGPYTRREDMDPAGARVALDGRSYVFRPSVRNASGEKSQLLSARPIGNWGAGRVAFEVKELMPTQEFGGTVKLASDFGSKSNADRLVSDIGWAGRMRTRTSIQFFDHRSAQLLPRKVGEITVVDFVLPRGQFIERRREHAQTVEVYDLEGDNRRRVRKRGFEPLSVGVIPNGNGGESAFLAALGVRPRTMACGVKEACSLYVVALFEIDVSATESPTPTRGSELCLFNLSAPANVQPCSSTDNGGLVELNDSDDSEGGNKSLRRMLEKAPAEGADWEQRAVQYTDAEGLVLFGSGQWQCPPSSKGDTILGACFVERGTGTNGAALSPRASHGAAKKDVFSSEENQRDEARWMGPRQMVGRFDAGEQGKFRGIPYSFGGLTAASLAGGAGSDIASDGGGAPFGHLRGVLSIRKDSFSLEDRVSPYPFGIDCSAFVAAVWANERALVDKNRVASVVPTSQMLTGQEISVQANGSFVYVPRGRQTTSGRSCVEPVQHFSELEAGDILLGTGHVVVFAGTRWDEGSLRVRVYEAASRCGRVCETLYDADFFNGWWMLRRDSGDCESHKWVEQFVQGRPTPR